MTCRERILTALADGKARTSADIVTLLGDEKAARVRYHLRALADQGRLELVDTDFGDRCPCCKRALRRPLALWRVSTPVSPSAPVEAAQRLAPSPSGIDWLITEEEWVAIDLRRLARAGD